MFPPRCVHGWKQEPDTSGVQKSGGSEAGRVWQCRRERPLCAHSAQQQPVRWSCGRLPQIPQVLTSSFRSCTPVLTLILKHMHNHAGKHEMLLGAHHRGRPSQLTRASQTQLDASRTMQLWVPGSGTQVQHVRNSKHRRQAQYEVHCGTHRLSHLALACRGPPDSFAR